MTRSISFARVRRLTLGAALALLTPGAALADAVYLKNGDRISGTVEHLNGDVLEITLPYADDTTIKIDVSEIVSIETDEEVNIMLEDGTLSKARLERVPEGGVILRRGTGVAQATIPLQQLAYIKPSAKESGVGVDWSGGVILGVTDTSGNTDTRDAYVEAGLKATAKEWRWTSGGRAKYAENSGTQTAGSWLVDTRFDWFFLERQYLYARASAQRDTFSGIDLRWTAGAGYGYKVLESGRTNLELRAGLDHVSTKRVVPPNQEYLALGWGITFDYWLVQDRLQFYFGQEGFADPQGDEGLVIRSRTGLRAPIMDDLSANFQVNLDYNSDPGPGFKTTDRTYIVGLGYKF
jgi:putative salt-induced outer membrane protein YdiY